MPSRIRPAARLLCFAFVLGTIGACSSPPPVEHPVARAPEQLTHLRIHVRNASHERAREAEENVTGYTIMVRGAVQRALIRAGYVVVVRPDQPHDLAAQIDTEHHYLGAVRGALTTTLTLYSHTGVVDQRSGVVDIDEHADIDERGAIALVESLARSARLRAFAQALPPEPPARQPTPQLATDGPEPSPGGAASTASATGPAPAAGIELRNLGSPGAFEIANVGTEPIELAWAVQVERQHDGRWQERGVKDLYLLSTCDTSQERPCVALAAGQSLRPVPWTGFDCASQCGPPRRKGAQGAMTCFRNSYVPGTYRFVVSACEGGARFVGPAFELPAAHRQSIFDGR